MDIIKDNPDKPWNWYGVSRNPNITWDIIENNLDKTIGVRFLTILILLGILLKII